MERITINLHHTTTPSAVGGMITKDGENQYTIIINENRSQIGQLASFLHEMVHVYNNDFDKSDVAEIEAETNKQLIEALEYLVNEGSE